MRNEKKNEKGLGNIDINSLSNNVRLHSGLRKEGAEDSNQSNLDNFQELSKPSKLCLSLNKLKLSAFKAVETRERLPIPFFWSLFYTEVNRVKKERERIRALKKLLYGLEL